LKNGLDIVDDSIGWSIYMLIFIFYVAIPPLNQGY